MKHSDYWRGRFAILEEAAQKKADRCIRGLEDMFRQAEQTVQADMERWYGRFAANNRISLTEARKLLTAGQLEEFRWTVEQYVKIGQQGNLSPEWIRKLENASARFHISRLESVQLQIQQQIELLYGNQLDSIDDLLRDVVSNGYTKSAFEIQKGMGLGWDITALNPKHLETLLSKPWTMDKRTFRDRCWEGKANLITGIQSSLTQGLLRGDSSQKIADGISKQFGVSKYKAARLVHTETTYFNAISSLESYKELGVDRVEIIETLDSHTCEICQPFDGMVISIAQCEPGVSLPPFHPNCRGTIAPAIEDEIIGERAARNADGEVYYVPSNMRYSDWAKTFMEGGAKDGLTVAAVDAIINMGEEALHIDIEIDQFTPCLIERHTGNVINTSYALVSPEERKELKKQGWLFNWNHEHLKNSDIYKLTVDGDPIIQGLVAIENQPKNYAFHLSLAESAPHNKGLDKQFDGVGGHLFAIAVKKSYEAGYGGFIYFEAKNMELARHYQQKFGAILLGRPHEYSMIIDEEAAGVLLEAYTLEE